MRKGKTIKGAEEVKERGDESEEREREDDKKGRRGRLNTRA